MRDADGNAEKSGEQFHWERLVPGPQGDVWEALVWASGPKDIEVELLDKQRDAGATVTGYRAAGVWLRFSLVRPGAPTRTLDEVRRTYHEVQLRSLQLQYQQNEPPPPQQQQQPQPAPPPPPSQP